MSDLAETMAKLREPFPQSAIDQLPKGGRLLDYVGHAAVTDRLLKVDPEWNWEPVAFDADGLPAFTRAANGAPVGLWIRLTIGGVSRLGFGSVAAGAFDAEKQLIGDALRNAAMRFGVALDLWAKSDLYHEDEPEARPKATPKAEPSPSAPESGGEPSAPASGDVGEVVMDAFLGQCDLMGIKLKPLCMALGYTPKDAADAVAWLQTLPARQGVQKWIDEHPGKGWQNLVSQLADQKAAAS